VSPQAGTAHRQHGGRQKRVERALSGQVGPPPFSRARFPFTPPEEEQLERMEAAAARILAEIGMDIRVDAEMLSRFRAAGPGKRRVRFQPGLVRALRPRRQSFTQHARNPACGRDRRRCDYV
jgi:trimethylamine---corrinoid protein Co-methyltransferase